MSVVTKGLFRRKSPVKLLLLMSVPKTSFPISTDSMSWVAGKFVAVNSIGVFSLIEIRKLRSEAPSKDIFPCSGACPVLSVSAWFQNWSAIAQPSAR